MPAGGRSFVPRHMSCPLGPFAVVVADMRMPGMDGVEFLQHVKEMSPDTVRIMLTGNADMQTAIDAVNKGNIFRFLTKPCPYETMTVAVNAGDRKSTRLNSSHTDISRMPASA